MFKNKIASVNAIAYKYNNIKNEWIPINNIKKIFSYYFYILLPTEYDHNVKEKETLNNNEALKNENDIKENKKNNDSFLSLKNKEDKEEENKIKNFNEEIKKKKEDIFPYPAIVIVIFNQNNETSIISIEKFFPSKIFIEKGNSYFCVIRTEQLLPIIGFQFTSSILLDCFITQFEKNLVSLKNNKNISLLLNNNQPLNNQFDLNNNKTSSSLLKNWLIPISNDKPKLKLTIFKNNDDIDFNNNHNNNNNNNDDDNYKTYNTNTNTNINININEKTQTQNKTQKQKNKNKFLYNYYSYYGTIMTTSITISKDNDNSLLLYIMIMINNYKYYKNISNTIIPIEQIFLASKIMYNQKEWTGLPLFEKNILFLEMSPLESIQIQQYLNTNKILTKYINFFSQNNNYLINTMKHSLAMIQQKLTFNLENYSKSMKAQLWILHHEIFHFLMYGIKNLNYSYNFTQENFSLIFKQNIEKYQDLWKKVSSIFHFIQNNDDDNNHNTYFTIITKKETIEEKNNSSFYLSYIPNFKIFQNLWYSLLPKNFNYNNNESNHEKINEIMDNDFKIDITENHKQDSIYNLGFVSSYAMTSFYEDLAETWAFLLMNNVNLEDFLNTPDNNYIQEIIDDKENEKRFKRMIDTLSMYYDQNRKQTQKDEQKKFCIYNYQLLKEKIELLLSFVFLNIK
ncbi:hypothetical protein BCR32DRAFT_292740 [Anaeromyces robustus]|uniref:Uncharacterized protein n=1 Tax=Anaeromyces robustus TaxID=1754192 RepID=A0A1Y1XAB7_9FUNG|nr:hypothetical protein BCR32DRAFT_292740 [Anaeromyces robustus]|eukprot:ORX82294.1 hypothetical protein BCR32DRAFT_292740 [Anaeromyces robustus]